MKNKVFSAVLVLLGIAPAILPGAAAAAPACQSSLQPTLPKKQTRPPKTELPKTSALPDRNQPIDIESDGGEYARDGNMHLEHATIKQGEWRLSADYVEYDAAANAFHVRGNVEYSDPQVKIHGETGTFDHGSGARITAARFELPERSARGEADEIAVLPGGEIKLTGVKYTTCPADDVDWILKAASISLDTGTRNGTGRTVLLDFQHVPILYTPIISFPLGNERKSGFLFPDFGHSSRSGIELSAPYYFNLAPNYDLTLTPHLYSRRGVGLDPEFRYLTQQQSGTVLAHFLPGDKLRNDDRSLVEWLHRADFAHNWRLNINAANASDQFYFEDFGLGTEGASITYLERSAELEHYGRHWTLLAQVQNFQTIDQTIPDLSRPYSRLPRLLGRGSWNSPLGFNYSLNSELVYFRRDANIAPGVSDVNGARFDLQPQVSWSFTRPGLYITPAAAYRQTDYRLDHVAPGASDSPNRGAPIGSLDAGMIFERTSGRHANRVQTLEPRLLYLYVPYRDQTELPVFDSGLPDLNLVQLFRTNRYVGADRLSDANQVSFGVTSRLLDADSGRQFLSATFGQTYYFDSPKVVLPGEIPVTRHTSNFISQLALTAYKDWNINLGHEWNPASSDSEKTELALQYRPSGDRVVNAGYRFRRGLIEQVDSSVAWPVAKNWNVYARGVYSLRDHGLIEQFAGFEYASCCWRLRLVQRRYVSDRTGERDNSFAIQLELNGLSSVGVPADAFLERSIRGYSRDSAR